jgi:hypothetical protein
MAKDDLQIERHQAISGKTQVASSGAIQLVPGYNYVDGRKQSPSPRSASQKGRKGNAPSPSSRGDRGE